MTHTWIKTDAIELTLNNFHSMIIINHKERVDNKKNEDNQLEENR